MRAAYCYLPMLRSRAGHFAAVRTLSPAARARLAPLFDILPPSNPRQSANPAAYLDEKVQGIVTCWAPDRPVYVDAHDFPVDTLVDHRTPVEIVCEGVFRHGFHPVPVTGTHLERGDDYLMRMARLAASMRTGLCLRIERDDIIDAEALRASLARTAELAALQPENTDIILDLDFVGDDSPMELHASILQALGILDAFGAFRNVVLVGGSIPEHLPKKDAGAIRREPRVELQVWLQLLASSRFSFPIALGDYGIVSPRYVKPGRPVNVPSRVRYSTVREHILLRAGRSQHAELCKQLVAMEDYSGASYSAGDQRTMLSASGLAGSGNPGIWVAGDLNHHLELVAEQVWTEVRNGGLGSRYSLPEPRPYPWLQAALLES